MSTMVTGREVFTRGSMTWKVSKVLTRSSSIGAKSGMRRAAMPISSATQTSLPYPNLSGSHNSCRFAVKPRREYFKPGKTVNDHFASSNRSFILASHARPCKLFLLERGECGVRGCWRGDTVSSRTKIRGQASREARLDDVEVGGVQLRLEYPGQGNRIVGIDGDDCISVAIIMGCVQGRQRVRKDRALELERIGFRMEVRHRGMADVCEIEDKGVACGNTAQCLVRRACDDGAARQRAGILHDDGVHGRTRGRRVGNKCAAIAVALGLEIRRRVISCKFDGIDYGYPLIDGEGTARASAICRVRPLGFR